MSQSEPPYLIGYMLVVHLETSSYPRGLVGRNYR